MKVKYTGPGSFVNVEPYGQHMQNEIKDYPEDFAKELVDKSKKQQFEIMSEPTVTELKALLDAAGINYPPTAKKADLMKLSQDLNKENA